MTRTQGKSANWQRVEEIFDQLLDDDEGLVDGRAPDVADRRLDELCGGDAELRREVRELLARSGDRHDVLDEGLAAALPELLDDLVLGNEGQAAGSGADSEHETTERAPARYVGRTIDRYRLLEVLGRGGMGVVYLAERADEHFEKKVALKVMPRGLESPERERRFLTERQILARLEHENIARLLDGGVTDEGYPYLVMELVRGESIDRYCDLQSLAPRERLGLFLDVCSAVHYAHRNLVIHRDLKPGNILVTSDGTVKLLDFGVGKILDDPDGDDRTRFQPMTPGYASPEQLRNQPVSTATDIYSLGAVLHQLLTGTPPSRSGESKAPAAALSGDLGVIVDRAQRQSEDQRFGSASEMAEDVRRFLNGLPIESRPRSAGYRLGKFVGRHRVGVALVATAAILAIVAVLAIARQGRIAALERNRARSEAQKAQSVAELLGSLLGASDPNGEEAGQLSARDLLERGEARVRAQLADQPEVRGEMLSIIGWAYASLGDVPRGEALLESAVGILRDDEPVDRLAVSRSLRRLAAIYRNQGRIDEMGVLLRESLELLEGQSALETSDAGHLFAEFGRWRQALDDHEEADSFHRRALGIFEELGDETSAAVARLDLGVLLDRTDHREEALRLKRRALTSLLSIHGEKHPLVAGTRNDIAITLHRLGDYPAAESLYREAITANEKTLGQDHPGLADILTNLGKVLMDQGRFREAEPYLARAGAIVRRSLNSDALHRIAIETNLASLAVAFGRYEEAIGQYRDGLERLERSTGRESRASTRVRSLLGIAVHRNGDPAAAEVLLDRALEAQRREAVPSHLAETLVGKGAVLSDLARPEAAEELLREGLARWQETIPSDHWRVIEAQVELAGALLRKQSPSPREQKEALGLLSRAGDVSFDGPGHEWIRTRVAAFAGVT